MHTTNPSNFSSGLGAPRLATLRSLPGTRRCERGFTLIEVMVVVAIVAIIAAIALPSYQQSVRASRRADAVLALQQIQIAQERLRAECNSYAAGLAAARFCDPGNAANNRLAFRNSLANGTGTSDNGLYTLALSNITPAGYTATATAVAGTSQVADIGCDVLTLAVAGQNLTRTPAECWTR
jgi:type IV pilus assembly protein PilE